MRESVRCRLWHTGKMEPPDANWQHKLETRFHPGPDEEPSVRKEFNTLYRELIDELSPQGRLSPGRLSADYRGEVDIILSIRDRLHEKFGDRIQFQFR